jgi:hypothetical protein
MRGRYTNLACGVIWVPQLLICTSISLNLLIGLCEVQNVTTWVNLLMWQADCVLTWTLTSGTHMAGFSPPFFLAPLSQIGQGVAALGFRRPCQFIARNPLAPVPPPPAMAAAVPRAFVDRGGTSWGGSCRQWWWWPCVAERVQVEQWACAAERARVEKLTCVGAWRWWRPTRWSRWV